MIRPVVVGNPAAQVRLCGGERLASNLSTDPWQSKSDGADDGGGDALLQGSHYLPITMHPVMSITRASASRRHCAD
jgi:hypothetical protein